MGGRGSSASRGTLTKTNPQEKFIDQRVDMFKGIKAENIEETLGLTKLTQSQKITLASMLKGMAENDHSHDENHTPYKITQFSVHKVGEEFSSNGTSDVQVLVSTYGDTGRSYIDMLDHRTRLFIIGKKGGAYTFDRNRKRKNVSDFDVRYGSID